MDFCVPKDPIWEEHIYFKTKKLNQIEKNNLKSNKWIQNEENKWNMEGYNTHE